MLSTLRPGAPPKPSDRNVALDHGLDCRRIAGGTRDFLQERGMPIKSMEDLFANELRDIYHAEKQLIRALPKLRKAASSDELKQCFEQHLEETRGQAERLEQVFELLELPKRAKRCEAM